MISAPPVHDLSAVKDRILSIFSAKYSSAFASIVLEGTLWVEVSGFSAAWNGGNGCSFIKIRSRLKSK